jgi:hypothetical protein
MRGGFYYKMTLIPSPSPLCWISCFDRLSMRGGFYYKTTLILSLSKDEIKPCGAFHGLTTL